jgi:hypothetical protein
MSEENLPRTPEAVISQAIGRSITQKNIDTGRIADRIMRALNDAGFAVKDARSPAGKTYSREDVSRAVNAGADLVLQDGGFYLDEGRDWSLVNLVANAALSLLDDPGMSLDDVIGANWQERDEDGNDVTVETVRGWLA